MRTRDHRVFLLTAYAMFYSFAYGAMRPDANSVFDDPAMLLRMAIPALAGLFALRLRNQWAGAGNRPQYAPALDLGVAIAFVLVSQWTLSFLRPELVLPRWIPSQGALVGWWFIAILRALAPPGQMDESPVDEEDDRRYKTGTLLAAGALFLLGSTAVVESGETRVMFGGALIMSGALFLFRRLRRVEHKADICRQAYVCYVFTIIPAAVLALWGHGIYIFNFMMYILLGAELIYRGSEQLNVSALAPAL
jgi:hypothetical protein